MLVNFSNHPYDNWEESQKEAAKQYGDIAEYRFPSVDPHASTEEVAEMAEKITKEIVDMKADAVMCMGEFTLTMAMVKRLQKNGIKTIAACAERRVKEDFFDGILKKTSYFQFVRFREYESLVD